MRRRHCKSEEGRNIGPASSRRLLVEDATLTARAEGAALNSEGELGSEELKRVSRQRGGQEG